MHGSDDGGLHAAAGTGDFVQQRQPTGRTRSLNPRRRSPRAVGHSRAKKSVYGTVLCALLVLTACGEDSDDPVGPPGGGAERPAADGAAGEGAGNAPRPGASEADAKPSRAPGVWESTEFKDLSQAPPLGLLKTADCPSYTTALADYGNHPSGGMVTKTTSIKPKFNPECIGWRTGDPPSVRDIEAGHMEYELAFNCDPLYKNIDQMDMRLSEDLKEASGAGAPGTPSAFALSNTYSPFYRLSEFEQGYAFAVLREGVTGSSNISARYITGDTLCSVDFKVQRWTVNSDGNERMVGLGQADTFKELTLIINAMAKR